MKPEFMEAYPELLEDAWAKMSAHLQGAGYDRTRADNVAFQITEYLRSEWSGRMLYILKKKAAPQEKQDALFETEAAPVSAEATSNVIKPGHLAVMARRFAEIIQGSDPAKAARLGDELVELLRADWASTSLFIPKGSSYETTRRDYAIWRRWDGTYQSKLALMQEHDLTEQAFYAAIRRIRKSHLRRTQPRLPGVGE
jgi:Mor family transcriptional regulator